MLDSVVSVTDHIVLDVGRVRYGVPLTNHRRLTMVKKPYTMPTLVEYGTISSLTGDFGSTTVDDIEIDPGGNQLPGDGGSIDGCALEGAPGGGRKCICTDENTC